MARPVTAIAPIKQNQDQIDESGKYKFTEDGAIQPLPSAFASGVQPTPVRTSQRDSANSSIRFSGRHSTRAEKQISEEQLSKWLSDRRSPLALHAGTILDSRYWSTILGICTIEQYGCSRAPYNNYWGIMCGRGKLCHYASLEEGIKAIDSLLTNYEARGYDTIEKLNCYYVQPCSQNWLTTVLKTKTQLESLTSS